MRFRTSGIGDQPDEPYVSPPDRFDEGAFDALYDEHYRGAYRLAFVLCGEKALAEDCTGEAFLNVWRQWKAGRVQNFERYLRTAVRNEVHRAFRHRRLERRDLARRGAEPTVDVLGPDTATADRALLVSALAELPLGQREAVTFRYLFDLSEVGTANALGVSTGTVKKQLSRGLDRLERLLSDGVLS